MNVTWIASFERIVTSLITSLIAVSVVLTSIPSAYGFVAADSSSLIAQRLPKIVVPTDSKSKEALLQAEITAHQAIAMADVRPIQLYLGPSTAAISLQDEDRFEKDLRNLFHAHQVIGFADTDSRKFDEWWSNNRDEILSQRAGMSSKPGDSITLENFFMQVYLKYKIDERHNELSGKEQPDSFVKWLESQISNPQLRSASVQAFNITHQTGVYILGVLSGAAVAGPAASCVSAFLETLVRPVREKVAVLGSRWFSRFGLGLNQALFKTPTPGQEQNDADTSLSMMNEARQKMLSDLGFTMTDKELHGNDTAMQDSYRRANQVWNSNLPLAYQFGRSMINDGAIFRAQNYSDSISAAATSIEIFKQGVESRLDAIHSRHGQAAYNLAKEFLTKIEEREDARSGEAFEAGRSHDAHLNSQSGQDFGSFGVNSISPSNAAVVIEQEVQSLRQQLISQTGDTDLVSSLEEKKMGVMINQSRAATATAAFVFREFQSPENNTALPHQMKAAYEKFRGGYRLDYYSRQYSRQVAALFESFGFQIKATAIAEGASVDLSSIDNHRATTRESSQSSRPRSGSSAAPSAAASAGETEHRPAVEFVKAKATSEAPSTTSRRAPPAAAERKAAATTPAADPAAKARAAMGGYTAASPGKAFVTDSTNMSKRGSRAAKIANDVKKIEE